MGEAGVSLDDFCRLTPDEIDAILRCRGDRITETARRDWEVMRLQTYMTLAPFCQGLSSPGRLLPFPWDDDKAQEEAPAITPEERRENERRLRESLGW